MGSEKIETFINYLDERTSSVQKETIRLIEDNRKDEADFEKIRANIFQMIKTVFLASDRISQEEDERVRFLDSRLTLFRETWETSLSKAGEHNDDLKMLQEQTKLEVLAEIQDTFQKIWGC